MTAESVCQFCFPLTLWRPANGKFKYRSRWAQQNLFQGRRRQTPVPLPIGRTTKKKAEAIERAVSDLERCRVDANVPHASTTMWLADVSGELHVSESRITQCIFQRTSPSGTTPRRECVDEARGARPNDLCNERRRGKLGFVRIGSRILSEPSELRRWITVNRVPVSKSGASMKAIANGIRLTPSLPAEVSSRIAKQKRRVLPAQPRRESRLQEPAPPPRDMPRSPQLRRRLRKSLGTSSSEKGQSLACPAF
ncbi:hypothetical protein PLANPX_2853 [Lacipirellula parvula]|uniref:Uncharacterized protein n=1 Tax=Lacipirellula parvula TaxID=2650471 RepID=A0A5K7XEE3_9BACT|nr:hypothetical protein PLANPX_2853 [Lacipirellula parvula]